MTGRDGMSFRQYIAASGVALFSPVSRLLPKAALAFAGRSCWLSPLLSVPPLLFLVWRMHRLQSSEDGTVGLAEAFERRLGRFGGKALTAVFTLWLLFYGGFILRSGGERLLSTIYPTARLGFFLAVLMGLSTVFALGRMRTAGRSAMVTALLFGAALALIFAMALPTLHGAYVWPPAWTAAGGVCLAAVPVADVLSPWVYFGFLRGRVAEDDRALPRALRSVLFIAFITALFLLATVGGLGPALSARQQFPFFVMIKNLTLFHVMERFDALVVVIWLMTDYVCIGMLLLSASSALQSLSGSRRRQPWALAGAVVMLAAAFLVAPDAFAFARISEVAVPAVNLALAFGLLPLVSFLPAKKLSKK